MFPRAALACLLLTILCGTVRSETLDDLVAREEGVDFGLCRLQPRPDLSGETVHAVIPARFENPGSWVTRTLLLVGIDRSRTVQGEVVLHLDADVSPRETIGVVCKGNRLVIRPSRRMGGAPITYAWTGRALKRVRHRR